MIKLLDKIVFIVSIGAILGLTGSYLASYINPNSFVIPSLLGLGYPYLLVANILLLLYWTTRWKKMAWIILSVILLGIPAFMTYYGTNSDKNETKEHDISILSYNIRYFDIYGWSQKKNTKEKLFEYLNKYKGDVICLQEFSANEFMFKKQDIINQLTTYKYNYIYKDMAFFSRIPLSNCGNIKFDKKYTSSCIYCDLLIAGQKVRLYSIHLESYKMGKQERKFMKEMSDGLKSDNITTGVKNITSRLIDANKNRAIQAEQIKTHISKSPYEVILCGDFNDTPLSYTYKNLKSGLKDCFIEKGRGLGNTYIGEFPSFRIDYILHTQAFETVSYSRENITLSDHYPVAVKLKIKK